jgi:hypothetical protein
MQLDQIVFQCLVQLLQHKSTTDSFFKYGLYRLEENNFQNSQTLICALNFREKEYWTRTLKYHQEQYKDLDLFSGEK